MIPKGMLDYIMWREKCGRNRARELYAFTPEIWKERYQKHTEKNKDEKIKRLESTLDQIESVIYNTQLTGIEARITIQEIIDKYRED